MSNLSESKYVKGIRLNLYHRILSILNIENHQPLPPSADFRIYYKNLFLYDKSPI